MDSLTAAPPVVAVVVADDPGTWFTESLMALDNQDYPNQSVLVLVGSGDDDASRQVATVLPDAYLRSVAVGRGFAGAANEVLTTVQGASFLLFCHDDAAPDPDAIRLMVEEALRSNAGIVGPKIVEWDRPDRLMEVGLTVDKTGACGSMVEPSELDQEQHDAVRDVFAVSTTFMLVRSDLFQELGGFDAEMGNRGADVDLCWRAQVAGARVVVAPAARVRHLAGGVKRPEEISDHDALAARHHVRAMLKSYTLPHLLRVLPQAAVLTIAETLTALAGRRWGEARRLAGAWWWNIRNLRSLAPMRRAIGKSRAVPDPEVRRLQARGSVRFTNYLQRRLHAEERAQALVAAGQELAESFSRGPARAASLLLGVLVLGIIIGSRGLIGGAIPSVGQLSPMPGVSTMLTHFVDGWRTTGGGSSAPAPPLFAALGFLGMLVAGNMDLLLKILIFSVWPIAALGAWRVGRPLQSPLPRIVGVVAYLAVPVPYNALARGRLGGLVAYAAAPWLLTLLARYSRLEPWGRPDDPTPRWFEALGLGVVVAATGVVAPAMALVVVVMAVGLVGGSVLVGGIAQAAKGAAISATAVGVAFVLLLPWSAELVLPGGGSTFAGVARAPGEANTFASLLRFDVGPVGGGVLGWAFLAAAALPLAVGRGWRLAWATRLWIVALLCIGVAWLADRGLPVLALQSPDLLLAPAAIALAASAGLGAAAFEVDLRRSRFGWRQAASLAAGATMVVVTLPVLASAPNGRWELPATEIASSVGWMEAQTDAGAFRVLWVGDPEFLPLDGWELSEGIAYATSRDGAPEFTDNLPGRRSRGTRSISDALEVAAAGSTSRLGRLLAPMAIRYLVLPRQLGIGTPAADTSQEFEELTEVFQSQLDLRLLPSDASSIVYENTAWGAGRSQLPTEVAAMAPEDEGAGADLSEARPILPGRGPVRFSGPIDAGTVLLAESPSSRWELKVDGGTLPRQDAFGSASTFDVAAGGEASLRYRTSVVRYLLLILWLALWIGVVRTLWRGRRRNDPGPRAI